MVREPAAAAGLRFEQDPDGERLDDVLRDEAAQDASLLPLLEFTLNELYERRSDHGKLTFEAYQAMGGVKGALAQRAESTFTGLPPEVQGELPAVFRQLVTIGTLSDETPTGQQTPLARFAAFADADAVCAGLYCGPAVRVRPRRAMARRWSASPTNRCWRGGGGCNAGWPTTGNCCV